MMDFRSRNVEKVPQLSCFLLHFVIRSPLDGVFIVFLQFTVDLIVLHEVSLTARQDVNVNVLKPIN